MKLLEIEGSQWVNKNSRVLFKQRMKLELGDV